MRIKNLLSMWVTLGLSLAGCGGKSDATDQMLDSAGEDTGADPTAPMPQDDGDGDASADDTGGDGDDDDDGGDPSGGGFIDTQDGGVAMFECDIWGQDCPDGQKCMPWDNSGETTWNATKCTPLDANPAQVGDECVAEGGGKTGIDNCELAAMCWAVDAETHVGTCVGFCSGSEANPTCNDPSTTCSITNSGVLVLCLPTCDPLGQDCPGDQGCYPVGAEFICAPNSSAPEAGNYGDPCAYLNVCNPGLFCASAAAVPNCQGAQGCCSEFCSLSDPDGEAQCQGAGGGQLCVPFYEDGQAPPAHLDVGVCVIPS
jgi:hypothetical protein